MITFLFFLFYITAANLEPLLYQNESDFFVADFGRSLTVSGDNRDKIAQMLYFRLQGHDSDLPFYSDVLQYGCWCQLIGDKWSISNKGTPVDDIDGLCKSWNKCNQCTKIDDSSQGSTGMPVNSLFVSESKMVQSSVEP